MNMAVEAARRRGVQTLRAEFRPTPKNGVVSDAVRAPRVLTRPGRSRCPGGAARWLSIFPTTNRARPTLPAQRTDHSEPEILAALTRILRDLLLDDSIALTMTTRRDDVRNWDSLAYITFMVAVETEFGVKFGVAEIESFENVGGIRPTNARTPDQPLTPSACCSIPIPSCSPSSRSRWASSICSGDGRATLRSLGSSSRRFLLCVVATVQCADHRAVDRDQLCARASSPASSARAADCRSPGSSWRWASPSMLPFSATSSTRTSWSMPRTIRWARTSLLAKILLPLGISFITFQKIAFLDRRQRRPREGVHAAGLLPVRPLLPAAHRGPDRALSGDDAAVPAGTVPLRCRERRGGHDIVRVRLVQEGRARGQLSRPT